MTRLLLVATAALVATSTCAAPVAQTDAEFCTLYQTTCDGVGPSFSGLSQADYTAKCKAFYTGAAAGTLGDPIDKTAAGATRACFQYHLSAAAAAGAGNKATHCPHARGTTLCVRAPDGAGGQIPLIASEFCAAYQKTCESVGVPFSAASQADYTAKCEAFYTGAAAGTLGNPIDKTAAGATRACFQYHLSAAAAAGASNKATHCPHARGTTLCVAAAPAAPAPVALTAAEFCASFETLCKKFIDNNFANTAACEKFYTGYPAGTLSFRDPTAGEGSKQIVAAAANATRACLQSQLSAAAAKSANKIQPIYGFISECENARMYNSLGGQSSFNPCVAKAPAKLDGAATVTTTWAVGAAAVAACLALV